MYAPPWGVRSRRGWNSSSRIAWALCSSVLLNGAKVSALTNSSNVSKKMVYSSQVNPATHRREHRQFSMQS